MDSNATALVVRSCPRRCVDHGGALSCLSPAGTGAQDRGAAGPFGGEVGLGGVRTVNLVPVQTVGDIETARALFREYPRFLGVDLDFQGFEEGLATLPGRYAPPSGYCWRGMGRTRRAAWRCARWKRKTSAR